MITHSSFLSKNYSNERKKDEKKRKNWRMFECRITTRLILSHSSSFEKPHISFFMNAEPSIVVHYSQPLATKTKWAICTHQKYHLNYHHNDVLVHFISESCRECARFAILHSLPECVRFYYEEARKHLFIHFLHTSTSHIAHPSMTCTNRRTHAHTLAHSIVDTEYHHNFATTPFIEKYEKITNRLAQAYAMRDLHLYRWF